MERLRGSWPLKICRRGQSRSLCFDPLKCHILSFKTVVGYLCKFHIITDGRLASKRKAKLIFRGVWNRFDGLIWLTQTPCSHILRQIYAIAHTYTRRSNRETKRSYHSFPKPHHCRTRRPHGSAAAAVDSEAPLHRTLTSLTTSLSASTWRCAPAAVI